MQAAWWPIVLSWMLRVRDEQFSDCRIQRSREFTCSRRCNNCHSPWRTSAPTWSPSVSWSGRSTSRATGVETWWPPISALTWVSWPSPCCCHRAAMSALAWGWGSSDFCPLSAYAPPRWPRESGLFLRGPGPRPARRDPEPPTRRLHPHGPHPGGAVGRRSPRSHALQPQPDCHTRPGHPQ